MPVIATGTAPAARQAASAASGAVKDRIDDLAICGGRPAFDTALHVGRPNIGRRDRLLARISDILDRRWLTNNGPYVQELERRVSAIVGVPHCVAVCNATVALELTIRALGLHGEVIVPALTFVATAHALDWQQITPVFCDVDPVTCTLDPARVAAAVTPRTTGIIGVHLWGRPCDVEGLEAVARTHGLKLLYDASHAFGCSRGGAMVGRFGDAEVFSFHATKFINSFEGGAVVTRDEELATKVRLMKNFGFAGYDEVIYPGTNGKMTEVCAAMALTSLESLEQFVATNERNHRRYARGLLGIPGLRLLACDPRERSNYQYVVLDVDGAASGLARDELVAVLHAENVLARRYFYPGCHRMEPYRTRAPHAGRKLPQTERLLERVLTLPTGTAIGADEIDAICRIIRVAVAHAPEVRRALAGRDAATVSVPTDTHRGPARRPGAPA